MRDKFKAWQQLTSKSTSLTKYFANKRILDFPGFQEQENDIVFAHRLRRNPSQLHIDVLSKETFGITEADTHSEWLDYADRDDISNDAAVQVIQNTYNNNEERYKTADVSDEEAVQILLQLGFDFRDELGHPLRLTNFFKRQAEAVARNLKGKMPDLSELRKPLNDQKWEVDLLAKRDQFIKSKKGN